MFHDVVFSDGNWISPRPIEQPQEMVTCLPGQPQFNYNIISGTYVCGLVYGEHSFNGLPVLPWQPIPAAIEHYPPSGPSTIPGLFRTTT